MLEKSENQSDTPFLKPDIVKAAKNKTVKITDVLVPEIVDTTYGKKLRVSCVFDGEDYTWTMNNTTKDSLIDEFGADETKWAGKETSLGTTLSQTKEGKKLTIYTKNHLESTVDV